jgi:hypothetical protein
MLTMQRPRVPAVRLAGLASRSGGARPTRLRSVSHPIFLTRLCARPLPPTRLKLIVCSAPPTNKSVCSAPPTNKIVCSAPPTNKIVCSAPPTNKTVCSAPPTNKIKAVQKPDKRCGGTSGGGKRFLSPESQQLLESRVPGRISPIIPICTRAS